MPQIADRPSNTIDAVPPQGVDHGREHGGEHAGGEQTGQHREVHTRVETGVDRHDAGGEREGERREHGQGLGDRVAWTAQGPEDRGCHGSAPEHEAGHEPHTGVGEGARGSGVDQCDGRDDQGRGSEQPPDGARVVVALGDGALSGGLRRADDLQVDDREQRAVLQVGAGRIEVGLGARAVEHRVTTRLQRIAEAADGLAEGVVEGQGGVDPTVAAEHHDFAPLGRRQQHALEVSVQFAEAFHGAGELGLGTLQFGEFALFFVDHLGEHRAALRQGRAEHTTHGDGLGRVVDARGDVLLGCLAHVDALLQGLPVASVLAGAPLFLALVFRLRGIRPLFRSLGYRLLRRLAELGRERPDLFEYVVEVVIVRHRHHRPLLRRRQRRM
jgi:hypothetical protein